MLLQTNPTINDKKVALALVQVVCQQFLIFYSLLLLIISAPMI
jgi:hypothetical protein